MQMSFTWGQGRRCNTGSLVVQKAGIHVAACKRLHLHRRPRDWQAVNRLCSAAAAALIGQAVGVMVWYSEPHGECLHKGNIFCAVCDETHCKLYLSAL